MTQDKVTKCRDNLVRQREEATKDPKKVNRLFAGFFRRSYMSM